MFDILEASVMHLEYPGKKPVEEILTSKGAFFPRRLGGEGNIPPGGWEKTSSNPEDLVMDCFTGNATALVAAEYTGRRRIGVDNSGYRRLPKRL